MGTVWASIQALLADTRLNWKTGDASRTAKENWLTNYINGGRLDKAIQIEMDKMYSQAWF